MRTAATSALLLGLTALAGGCTPVWVAVEPSPLPAGTVVACPTDDTVVKLLGFLADGKQLVLHTGPQKVWVFDTRTGRAEMQIPAGEVRYLPGGKFACNRYFPKEDRSGFRGISVGVWDLSSPYEKCILEYFTRPPLGIFALSDDGACLALGSYNQIVLFDGRSGLPTGLLKTDGELSPTAFSPDGKLLVTCGEGGLQLWDVSAGRIVRSISMAEFGAGFVSITVVCFSASGKTLVVREAHRLPTPPGYKGLMRVAYSTILYEVATGKCLFRTPPGEHWGGAISEDRSTLIVPAGELMESRLLLYDLDTGTQRCSISASGEFVTAGEWLAAHVPSMSREGRKFALWNMRTGQKLSEIVVHSNWQLRALSGDGRLLCLENGWAMCLMDMKGNRKLLELHSGRRKGWPPCVAKEALFSPNGRKLAITIDGRAFVIDLERVAGAVGENRPN